ncbi:hypothetical protein BGZ58_003390 [Dissophora ornata]|nr:hypothetical protein BGZ58_003390 [Dissophora ornata]
MLTSPPLSAAAASSSSLQSSPPAATVEILLRTMRYPQLVVPTEYAEGWAILFEDVKVTVKAAVVDVYDNNTYEYMKEQKAERLRALDTRAEEAAALEASLKKGQMLIQQRMGQKQQKQQQQQQQKQGKDQMAGEGEGGEGEGQGEGDEDLGDVEEKVEYLHIKLRGKDTADEKIRVEKTKTVLAIIKHYKAIKKIAHETPVRLEFDDETIDPNMTIGDTEVEDDDMLLVWVG